MTTITKTLVLLLLCLVVSIANAQDSIPKTVKQLKIERLEASKESIKSEERELLKAKVEAINEQLENEEITQEEANTLKTEAAQLHALNIENRIAIVDNSIALLQRNENYVKKDTIEDRTIALRIGGENIIDVDFSGDRKPPKYDIRTTNDMLLAFGFNNALIDGQSLDDSPYKLGGSGFIELGWNWKTRIFKNTNFARIKYGFSFQWNKLDIKDNQYFVKDGDITTLEVFPEDLNKAKFRVTNLVIPVHLEFGPSKVLQRENRIRYINNNKFKIGLGGYAGVRLGSLQKLKYKVDGDRVKDKIKTNYNVSNFVYGISGYIGFGDTSLYVKYDLNPLFKDQAVDQHNISLGLRIDLD